jgi:hypothetical protein
MAEHLAKEVCLAIPPVCELFGKGQDSGGTCMICNVVGRSSCIVFGNPTLAVLYGTIYVCLEFPPLVIHIWETGKQ